MRSGLLGRPEGTSRASRRLGAGWYGAAAVMPLSGARLVRVERYRPGTDHTERRHFRGLNDVQPPLSEYARPVPGRAYSPNGP